ncbi:Asp-tRNA(Asn)/Glu-tRNA(Gln) amidotransferase subunit GatC [Neoactinobaculum massilliense]|uniref:Asp-tRNA(Asn)/Glu-tRNA(Gln) amidotransferase subunit GatC n=1 Tax=Neoactinobaculum massilliense TaxID=2364794 RepID=UPI000F537168|nr:Asp-tRNA(Asn)/Glu-tRNA(Gln) amidotransferase subunit GatC [Neoactinobaculum massilliense]
MSTFSKDVVLRLADLARIDVTPEEAEKLADELVVVENAVAVVSEVASPELQPTYNPLPVENVVREDVPGELLDRAEVLAQAPAAEDGKFLVPQILGEEA